jgi:WXG100 family type VII secretion target
MASLRRVHYDEMGAIVKSFRSEQAEIDALLKQTKSKVESLHNNQWVGQGAEKWFSEMESLVIPALGKLSHALGYAGDTAQKIHEVIHKGDEETKSFFNIDISINIT